MIVNVMYMNGFTILYIRGNTVVWEKFNIKKILSLVRHDEN